MDHYRRIYYEAIDMITTCINSRFDQPGYKIYCNIEDLLLKAANADYDAELKFVTQFYGSDFDGYLLKTQCFQWILLLIWNLEENTRFLIQSNCLKVNLKLKKICYVKCAFC